MDKATDFNDGATVDLGAAEAPKETTAEIVKRLAALPPIEFDRVNKEEAKKLGCKSSTLNEQVKRARATKAKQSDQSERDAKSVIECPDLEYSDPLILVDQAIAELGYGGDRQLPMLLYLCCTSRLLSFNAGSMLAHGQVVGAPSSGKLCGGYRASAIARGILPKD